MIFYVGNIALRYLGGQQRAVSAVVRAASADGRRRLFYFQIQIHSGQAVQRVDQSRYGKTCRRQRSLVIRSTHGFYRIESGNGKHHRCCHCDMPGRSRSSILDVDNCDNRRSDSIHRIYACTDIQEES